MQEVARLQGGGKVSASLGHDDNDYYKGADGTSGGTGGLLGAKGYFAL